MGARVVTVTGEIDPADLGITLTHEHLLVDATVYWDPAGPEEAGDPDRPVTIGMLGRLRRDPIGVTRANLRLDDPELAVRELASFRAAGGRTIVDLTPRGAGLDPLGVRAIARATGIQVVLGTAYYLERTHPAMLSAMSIDQIADRFARDLLDGFEEAPGDVRAGIIGELGTSDPLGPGEERVLRAAARAHRRTGSPLNVHLQEWGANGHVVLDALEAEGADLARTALSHLDSRLDHAYHASLAARGAFVSYDLWGTEDYRVREHRGNPSDLERAQAVRALVDAGYAAHLLVSTDVCTRVQLVEYGGYGYGHVLANVVPMLRDVGLGEDELQALLIDNPRRLLAMP